MPHLSRLVRDTMQSIRIACNDATTASALCERLLSILKPALAFDGAELLGLDGRSLLITRVLAHHGNRLGDLAHFLREVYLIEAEPEWLDLNFFLRHTNGAGTFHERLELWCRATAPPISQAAFTRMWRGANSPPGGGLRYGLRYRGNWVGVLQAARWTPSAGFRPSDLELLDLVAPTIARAMMFASNTATSTTEVQWRQIRGILSSTGTAGL